MKTTFSDRKQFTIQSIKPHLGLLGIWFAFIVFGGFFVFLGSKIEEGTAFIVIGFIFIILATAFMLFILPSSFRHYYEQAKIKKHGSYTFAQITNKRIDDYSHNMSSLNEGQSKRIKEHLYVIEFEFVYSNQTYKSECYFEHQSTFDAMTLDTELPIKFLKTNPKNVTLRRRKLSNQLAVSEKLCQ